MDAVKHIASPFRLYSGADSLGSLERELERLGSTRAVLFSGGTLARSGLLEKVKRAAGDRCAGVFCGVRAHSPHPTILEAATLLADLEADAVIAVGGGSAIVTARAASIYLAEGHDPALLCTSRGPDGRMRSPRLNARKLPQLVVPTTPTTAAVKAGTAVLDPVAGKRYAMFDPKTRAEAVFVDPELILSPSRELLVTSSLDSLSLAIEGLTSASPDPFARAFLVHAVRLMTNALSRGDLEGDATVRADLMHAALLCGRGTDFTSAGVATALGHAIGAHEQVENGISKAILLPHTLRFNADASRLGIADLCAALELQPSGHDEVERVIMALQQVFKGLGLPTGLGHAGVRRESFAAIAGHAMEDWFLKTNVRTVQSVAELEAILAASW